MTLDQFLQLNEAAQLNALWEARFVSERMDKGLLYTRYRVFDFYIEVCVKDKGCIVFSYFNVEQSPELADA